MILDALWWFGVATKVWGRDRGVYVERAKAGRDIDLRSRPSLLKLGVTTWALVTTGAGAAASATKRTCLPCAQQRPRPGHCALSVRATWVLGLRTVHPTQF